MNLNIIIVALIERTDLELDYNWSSKPGDSPINKENMGSEIFDNQKGEDVLNLLNDYAEKRNITDKKEILDAEAMLHEKLPKNLHTKENVMDWLWSALGHDEKMNQTVHS